MKKFSEFNEEASDEDNTKKSVLNLIATSLNRQASSSDKDKDTRSILMLIAALGMLNAKDDTGLSLSTARRLASGSGTKSNK
jgi:hypothetical protein